VLIVRGRSDEKDGAKADADARKGRGLKELEDKCGQEAAAIRLQKWPKVKPSGTAQQPQDLGVLSPYSNTLPQARQFALKLVRAA